MVDVASLGTITICCFRLIHPAKIVRNIWACVFNQPFCKFHKSLSISTDPKSEGYTLCIYEILLIVVIHD